MTDTERLIRLQADLREEERSLRKANRDRTELDRHIRHTQEDVGMLHSQIFQLEQRIKGESK